jgi:hypothetical protein
VLLDHWWTARYLGVFAQRLACKIFQKVTPAKIRQTWMLKCEGLDAGTRRITRRCPSLWKRRRSGMEPLAPAALYERFGS